MRLLIATDHYAPFIGGAHRQSQLLATAMAARGHEVAVATPWHGGLPRSESEDGFLVQRVRQLRTAIPPLVRSERQRHQPPMPDPVTIWDLRRLIARFEPELIHAHGWLAFSVAVAIGARRIPLLLSARDYGYFCATRTLLHEGRPCSGPAPLKCLTCSGDYYGTPKGWIAAIGVAASKPLLRRKATALHSVSTYVEEVTLTQIGKPDLISFTIPSFQAAREPVADEKAVDVESWLAKLPDEPFILYVGAFREVKGLTTLFEAYEQLRDPPPLVLMGTYERDSPARFPAGAVVLTDVPNEAVMAAGKAGAHHQGAPAFSVPRAASAHASRISRRSQGLPRENSFDRRRPSRVRPGRLAERRASPIGTRTCWSTPGSTMTTRCRSSSSTSCRCPGRPSTSRSDQARAPRSWRR